MAQDAPPQPLSSRADDERLDGSTASRVLAAAAVSIWLRHGDYEQPEHVPSAHLPHPLTPTGRAQARAAGETIADWVDALAHASPRSGRGGERDRGAPPRIALHTSSLLRAWETARIVEDAVRARGVEVVTTRSHDSLAERSLGAGANLTIEAIERAVARDPRCTPLPPGWKSSADVRLPWVGAESLREAGERVARTLREVIDETRRPAAPAHAGPIAQTLSVVVGHGAALRHAAVELGLLTREEVAGVSMVNARPLLFVEEPGRGWSRVMGAWKIRSSPARD